MTFCHASEIASSKGRQGWKGSECMGEEGGARDMVSAIMLRVAAMKAEEDMAVNERRPIPECLSDSWICWMVLGESSEGAGG